MWLAPRLADLGIYWTKEPLSRWGIAGHAQLAHRGGVSEWLRIANVAEVFGVTLSLHFLPELHVHLAAAAPNRPYIERFPLIDDVLTHTLPVRNGMATPPEESGHGIGWDEDELARLRVR